METDWSLTPLGSTLPKQANVWCILKSLHTHTHCRHAHSMAKRSGPPPTRASASIMPECRAHNASVCIMGSAMTNITCLLTCRLITRLWTCWWTCFMRKRDMHGKTRTQIFPGKKNRVAAGVGAAFLNQHCHLVLTWRNREARSSSWVRDLRLGITKIWRYFWYFEN